MITLYSKSYHITINPTTLTLPANSNLHIQTLPEYYERVQGVNITQDEATLQSMNHHRDKHKQNRGSGTGGAAFLGASAEP